MTRCMNEFRVHFIFNVFCAVQEALGNVKFAVSTITIQCNREYYY